MTRPLMKCGHTALSHDPKTGKPVCPICIGIVPEAEIVDENPPSLEGREARCTYCGKVKPSDASLPFFESRPDDRFDNFYDGCRGWD